METSPERTAVAYNQFTDFVQSHSLINIRLNAPEHSLSISDRNIDELEDCHAAHEQLHLNEIKTMPDARLEAAKVRCAWPL